MTDTASLTPQQRVLMVVGGNFSSASLGPRYDAVVRAIEADPRAHLQAFQQLFIARSASRLALTDLHLDSFLQMISRQLPEEARTAARQLLGRMASLARAQEREMAEADETSSGEIGRQQRELVARREVLARIARAA